MRRGFLALQWEPRSAEAAGLAARLAQQADGDLRWRRAASLDGLAVWRCGTADLPLQVLPQAAGLLLGEVFAHPDAAAGAAGATPDTAWSLSRRVWGAYVALLRDPGGRWTAFRDPGGHLDVLTWPMGDGVAVAASALTGLPAGLSPPHMALDWDRILAFLTVPVAATTACLFAGATAVGPGEAAPLGGGACTAVWSPLDHAAPLDAGAGELAAAFVERLDACVGALVRGHDRVLMELSGGLDSSAVAAALAATGNLDRVAAWLNVSDARPEADERRYAQAVAARLGVELTVVNRRPQPLQTGDFDELGRWTWPAITAVDASVDRDERARARACGATAILTGQGGDGLFFEMPSALVAADLWREAGLRRLLGDPRLAEVARRTRRTVWGVLAEARRGLRGAGSGPKNVNSLVTPEVRVAAAGTEHAWVRALAERELPPGKRVHVRALATNLFNHGACRRREAADLVHPFLAQTLMELALGVPTPLLAAANYARPFQREAFRERLPPLVRERRAKGNVSVYLARLMAASLPALRAYLLDGVLADNRILDRPRLEAVLDPDWLIARPAGTDLVGAVAVESWVRHWQGRVPDAPSSRWRR